MGYCPINYCPLIDRSHHSFKQARVENNLLRRRLSKLLLYDETMKPIIFLLGVCTFFCVAYASPTSFQFYNRLESLLDKITESAETSNAIVQAIDRAVKKSLNEKARADQFWGGSGQGPTLGRDWGSGGSGQGPTLGRDWGFGGSGQGPTLGRVWSWPDSALLLESRKWNLKSMLPEHQRNFTNFQ